MSLKHENLKTKSRLTVKYMYNRMYVNLPEVDPIPEALMAAAAAAAEAAGKLPRAAGTRGVRKTPEKDTSEKRSQLFSQQKS